MALTVALALRIVAVGIMIIGPLLAQSGRGYGGRGVSPSLMFSLLAFEEEIALTDAQLVQLRGSLKDLYYEQQAIIADVRSGEVDRRELQGSMKAMRAEMTTAISAVLTVEQNRALQNHMREMQANWSSGAWQGQGAGQARDDRGGDYEAPNTARDPGAGEK